MTLNSWIAQWLESYKNTVRPSTYQASGYILKNHIIPRLGDYELTALSEEVIGDFLDTVQQKGNHKRAEPMSQQAMRHILALLKQILDSAVAAKLVPENHAKQFNYKGKNRVDIEPLDDWEIEEYLNAAEELGHLPIFLLALEYQSEFQYHIYNQRQCKNPLDHTSRTSCLFPSTIPAGSDFCSLILKDRTK